MAESEENQGKELWRPNRHKATSKTTKLVVAIVLLISAGLLAVVTIGGWERLQSTGAAVLTIIFGVLYIFFAILVIRWNRGILPVIAALAVLIAIFGAVSVPSWFDRAKDGLDSPVLPEDLLGMLTVLVVVVQLVLVAVAMVAFQQEWNVEEERPTGEGRMAGEPA